MGEPCPTEKGGNMSRGCTPLTYLYQFEHNIKPNKSNIIMIEFLIILRISVFDINDMRIKTRPLGDAHLGCWPPQPALLAHCCCSPATSIFQNSILKLFPLLLLLTCDRHCKSMSMSARLSLSMNLKIKTTTNI